jgi:hypothetical protein
MKLLTLLFFLTITSQPRQVLVFYKEGGKALHDKQIAEFKKYRSGIKERDIEIKTFLYSAETESVWQQNKIDKDSAFTFILIGRDGGEKYRSVTPVSAAALFEQIDAMPMRRSEMRKNQ